MLLSFALRLLLSVQPQDRPFEILDNSFFVEEAFNQEKGVVQNINGFLKGESGWAYAFTQEWPMWSQTHQFSYTLPFTGSDEGNGVGDVILNYRYQALMEGPGRPAFSPRVSLILPSGNPDRGTGDGVVGWQFNLPFSKQRKDLYFHWNGGVTILPRVHEETGEDVNLVSPTLAGSAIWRMKPMLNPMLETVMAWIEQPAAGGATSRTATFTLSPGVRGGWNFGDQQLVLGFAVPVTWSANSTDAAAFLYLSYELPFKK